MHTGRELHLITRSCMGFHTWSQAGLGQMGDQLEAAVTAARIAASEGHGAVSHRCLWVGEGACARVAILQPDRRSGWTEWRAGS